MHLHVLRRNSPTMGGRATRRGQSLVLSCLSFMVLALMVALSFNLSHALREKVSLQQHSDSMAYSMAVMEARALNYYAASNRAIAASYVAMTSMHAYLASASSTGQIMRSGFWGFLGVAATEAAQCNPPWNISHCIHAIQAIIIAVRYNNKARSWDNKVKGLESDFNETIKGLNSMVNGIHGSQNSVHLKVAGAVRNGSANGLSQLTDYNVPGASSISSGVGGLNANEFNCSVDGMTCQGGDSNASKEALAKVMTEVSNATRPSWPAERGGLATLAMPIHLNQDFRDEFEDLPNDGTHQITLVMGTARVAQSKSKVHGNGKDSGNTGSVVVADEHGTTVHQWKHGFGGGIYNDMIPLVGSALVMSNESGGTHKPNGAHSGNHNEFKGINTKDLMSCTSSGNCFMKFRGSSDADKDFGQPRVYSYVTKQFKVGDKNLAPWELNSSGSVSFNNNAQGTGKLQLAPGEGAALSKALVYYHRLGENGWREAPNMFNPYWRAKLHPFTAEEAGKVLQAAGNSDAAQIAATPGVSL